MIRRPLTPSRVRILLTALATISLLPLACRIDPAPSLDIAGTSWRTFDSPLGFSIDYPDAYQVTDLGGGQPAFEHRGTIAARVVWVTEEEGRGRGLWFRAQPERALTMAGQPGHFYAYDHGDGPFFSRTYAAVIPHRGRFLGVELRTDGVDAVGQRMIDSVKVESRCTSRPMPAQSIFPDGRPRCPWLNVADPLYVAYHDEEWGTPVHEERHLFEMITLEGAQAGLSWLTVLRRREGYRRAFDGFDVAKIAAYTEADRERLLADPEIIRNRAKVDATIGNARASLEHFAAPGSFDEFLWSFVGGVPQRSALREMSDYPAQTAESKALSKALLAKGFRFVGPTIVYAFMQAVGMVDDHAVGCWRHRG